jgi:acyl carrier protein
MSIRDIIVTQFAQVAADQKKTLEPLTDDLLLLDCGIDSLCFAIIVANLEDELGIDPFTTADDSYFPATFRDFVDFYEREAN